MVGGKGGVGKTTCAAAMAVGYARDGRRVLVASTDPAPSLADALGAPLSHSPRTVPTAGGRLQAVEIDAARALRRWLKPRRATLERIAVQGTWLADEDVAKLLEMSLPGIDELAALFELARFAADSAFDVVVVDTAPTGHTLRMLQMPQMLAGLARLFDVMRDKQRAMEAALRGAWRPGAEDELIRELGDLASGISSLLRDARRTRVSWVTLAEPMAVAETLDALETLDASGIHVARVVVNRLTPQPAQRCGHCDARRTLESDAIRRLPPRLPIAGVYSRIAEPRGERALASIAREFTGADVVLPQRSRARMWTAAPTLRGVAISPAALVPPSVRLVMLGGKGGVGKTTCAAAMALSLAEADRSRRALLVSTDPAHSLADVFDHPVSDTATTLPGGPDNLRVREMDAAAFLARIRAHYTQAVDEMFDRLGGRSFDAAHDRSVLRSLIELAPPGLDELAAILETTDALLSDDRWDVVVMDTAPTGHALRLLEMPALIQDWTRAVMRILLEYQNVTRLGELGESLLNLSKGVGRLRQLLSDPEQSSFIAVTRAAALPRLETVRLIESLDALGIHLPAIVVNAAGRGSCVRCRRVAAAERREIAALEKTAGTRRRVLTTSAEVPPPHGTVRLRQWASRSWRVATGYHQHR